MEQFENIGDWWVPDTSERVSGKVSFAPSEGVVLKLNGSLPYEDSDPERSARAELDKDYPVLYGDLGREGKVTLLNATITSANFGGQGGSEGYFADRVILGEHLPQDPSFAKASFVVDEIPTWTNSSTVKPIFETEEVERAVEFDDIQTAYVTTSPDEYAADFGDVEITLSNYSNTSYMMESVEMETVGVLNIIPNDEVSLGTLYRYGNEVLEYLSFAIGTGIYPDKVQLYLEADDRPLDAYHTLPDY
ncbi:hypothetical protein, partial [Halobacterium salinarum]|uniref:ApeA N-terminal domain 1-containing protein n=1 Tax=Halobacterium salinarum TaxID=2242 RepID=UPI0025546101